MNVNINITTDKGLIVIQDLKGGYLLESATIPVKNKFKYSETGSICIIYHNKSSGSELLKPVYISHDKSDSVSFPLKSDQWLTVNYIVLPTKEWFNRELAKKTGSALDFYDVVYFLDGTTVYKYYNDTVEDVQLEEVFSRNPSSNCTISKTFRDGVSIYYLEECYLSLCLEIFKSVSSCNNIDNDLIYRRDLVWMAINTINYMIEHEQLAEAERILERIGGCNGLCKNEYNKFPNHDCGCK